MTVDLKNLQNILQYKYTDSEVGIDKSELVGLLGYEENNLPEPLEESIETHLDLINQLIKPVGGFVILKDQKVKFTKDRFYINDTCLKSEKIISRYLSESETIAILVATIGDDLEKLSRKLMEQYDYISGYITDKAASELVEKTADLIETELQKITINTNLNLTNRYSPGYCGWNVNDQHKLFSFLPKDFCDVHLTESALMIPIKSISAVIGIGSKVTKEDYSCKICDIDFCYKKKKQHE